MFEKVLMVGMILCLFLFQSTSSLAQVVDIPTREPYKPKVETQLEKFRAGLETAARVKAQKNLWPEISIYNNGGVAYTLNELIIVRGDESVLYHGRILFIPGTSEIASLSVKVGGFAIWLEGRAGSYRDSFAFDDDNRGKFFIRTDEGVKHEIPKEEVAKIIGEVAELQKPMPLPKPGETFSINVENPEGSLWWHKAAGGIRGSAIGSYEIIHGIEPESMEVKFNFSYQLDSEFVKNWVEKANSELKYGEKKEKKHLFEFGLHLWESYLSDLANRAMSESAGFPVQWSSAPLEGYQGGNFVFVYEDVTTKCRASALHERGSYSEAAMLYDEYARRKNDPFYLAWTGQEWVYAAEAAEDKKKSVYYGRALLLFSEAFEGDSFKGGIWLFEIAYGAALVNSADASDRDKGSKILSEVKVISGPGSSDPAEERLRQKYIPWYR